METSISLLAIFIASLLGSPHCAGMCGGFVSFCTTKNSSHLLTQVFYHSGRLITYCLLGTLAGLLGHSLDNLGVIIGIQKISAALMGLLLIFWGLKGLIKKNQSLKSNTSFLYKTALSLYRKVFKENQNSNWQLRSLMIGSLSTLLPCAWLYAYVAVAATSASWKTGLLVMLVFWFGTLPALISVGSLSTVLNKRLGRYAPRLVSILFVMAGFVSIFSHLMMHH